MKRKFNIGDVVKYHGDITKIASECLHGSIIGDYFLESLSYAFENELEKVDNKVFECHWHTYGISGEIIVDYSIWHDCEEPEEKNWFRYEPSKRLKG